MHNVELRYARWRLDVLLRTYPGLNTEPHDGPELRIAGDLSFAAVGRGVTISDSFAIEMLVPPSFPNVLPQVRETGGRIPRDFHQFKNGNLCLGSPIRLALLFGHGSTLIDFVETALIPYLFGFSFRERHGRLPFGELRHGNAGISQDARSFFHITDDNLFLPLLGLAALQRRRANRQPCPCGSGLRLGRCHNIAVNEVRRRYGRLRCRDLQMLLAKLRSNGKHEELMNPGRYSNNV